VDKNGDHPPIFTKVPHQSVVDGFYRASRPEFNSLAAAKNAGLVDVNGNPLIPHGLLEYTKALEDKGRFIHTLWPQHGVVMTPGACLHPAIQEAKNDWSAHWKASPRVALKGSNPFTEHFSGFSAEVAIAADATTGFNGDFLNYFLNDRISVLYICGIALRYCLGLSLHDILVNLGEDVMKKVVLVNGCHADIPGDNPLGDKILKELDAAGMRTAEVNDLV